MIARIWRGRTPAARADAYVSYLLETGVKDYAAVPGNRGVRVLRRLAGDEAEFLVVSFWDSHDAVRAFAGPTIDDAVYYPADDEYLLAREPGVAHYEVVVDR